ncbi:hypothetical protein ACGC1H_005811 [Rhizoctonia solani]
MDVFSRPRGPEGSSSKLHSYCRFLIRLALGFWRSAEIRSTKDFLAMMGVLVGIDEMLKYACSLGTINVQDLNNRISLLRLEIARSPNITRAFKSLALNRLAELPSLGDVEISGLGRIANPAPLVLPGDATNVPPYRHTDRLQGFSLRSPNELEERAILNAYRDQLSMQVSVLKRPIIQSRYFSKELETYFQTLGLEHPRRLLSRVHSPLGTNPRVYIIPTFKQNPKLYSLIERGHGQDVIFKDRHGNLYSSLDFCNWKGGDLPRRLYWTLYQLKVNKKEESDTPMELPLMREQATQSTPAEHFKTLLGTWQHIIELEGQPKDDLCIGWLIEINEFSMASPEASYYLRLLASKKGSFALSEKLECTLYPADLVSTTVSHSVLGRIHYGELGKTVARERAGLQGYCVKNIRSVRIDFGQISLPEGLDDNPATRLLRRWRKYNHPNVLQLLGIQEMPPSGIGLVLPNTNTKSLSEYLDAASNVDRCKLCAEISSGLAYLHASGVVHGHLRAANILVSVSGEAMISDPLLLGDNRDNNSHARVAWLAPEVIRGGCSTLASDVYSLGMSTQEVLGGVPSNIEGKHPEALNFELPDRGYVLPERPEDIIPTNSNDGDDLWMMLSQCCSINPGSRPIMDLVAEVMTTITQGGLQQLRTRHESANDMGFESRALQEESFELSDVESVSSTSSSTSFRDTNMDGLTLSNPKANHPILLGPESHMMARKILKQLAAHGCENLTDHIDWDSFSAFPLCKGGFGDVYRGKFLSGLRVAIKTPHVSLNILEENPDYLKDAAREIHTWSKCDHPNVLHFLGLAELRGQIGMVAPWMENGSSPRYLEKAFSVDRCRLCTQICEGVAYLHHIGIVHGDLKGENVFISGDGVAVIGDFGGSLLRNRSLNIIPLEKGTCLTYRWAAPELLLQGGVDEVDESNDTTVTRVSQTSARGALNTRESDIYALGMTILVSNYQALLMLQYDLTVVHDLKEIISSRVPWYWIKSGPAIIMQVCSPGKLHKRPRQEIPMHSLDGNKLWKLLTECWSYKPDLRPTAIEVGDIMRTISPGTLKPYPPAIGNRCALFV